MSRTIKALTISQPFATLIGDGRKWVENRCWPTKYRGPLAIHAGKGTQYLTRTQLEDFPTGCVLAVANLAACVELRAAQAVASRDPRAGIRRIAGTNRTYRQFLSHRHTEGPYCWVLSDVFRLHKPIVASGKQGLWEWECPPDIWAKFVRMEGRGDG